MNNGALIFHEVADPTAERCSEYFQIIRRVRKNPREVHDSRDHKRESPDSDIHPGGQERLP